MEHNTAKHPVQQIADALGGKIEEAARLPDGSGMAIVSFPLPADHWLLKDGFNNPPMPFRMGSDDPRRECFERQIGAAAEYAIRASTMNGKDSDFDPDAMRRNFITAMLGYWTADGLSNDAWANPDPVPPIFPSA